MKSVKELRNTLKLHPHEINSSVKYFANFDKEGFIDWNVYLPSKKMNLQRDFVWTIHQKREIIWSMLMKRHIPRMSMIFTIDDAYQVIDGKQRLSTMIDFYNGKFTLDSAGREYYFFMLSEEHQKAISGYLFAYYIVLEESEQNKISDQDKIDWFKFINFAGTPQDAEHLKALS